MRNLMKLKVKKMRMKILLKINSKKAINKNQSALINRNILKDKETKIKRDLKSIEIKTREKGKFQIVIISFE